MRFSIISYKTRLSVCEDHDTASNYFDSQIKPIPFKTYGGEVAESIFENIDTLEKNIQNLTMSDENVAKVVPFRIFSLAVHPTQSKLLVAAGDKWGSIGFWDVQSNGIQVIKVHTVRKSRNMNKAKWSPIF